MLNSDISDTFSKLKKAWRKASGSSISIDTDSDIGTQISQSAETSKHALGKAKQKMFNSLFTAALEGDVQKIRLLVEQGADLNGSLLNDWGLAHALALKGLTHILEELLDKGLNIQSEGPNEILPIQLAARSSNLSTIKWFIEKGSTVRSLDDLDLLHHVADGNIEKLADEFRNCQLQKKDDIFLNQTTISKYLIDEHHLDVSTKNADSWTPLHLAARNGNTVLMSLLITNGADPNSYGSLDKTPLHEAISNGHLDAVKLLVLKGVDLKAPDRSYAACPMRTAVEHGHIHIMEYLIDKGIDYLKGNQGVDLVSCAVDSLQLYVIKWYSHRMIGIKNYLEDCCSTEFPKLDIEILQWLKSIGFDLSQPLGVATLMHVAASAGQIDIMEYLKSQGVNLNQANHQLMTPVHRAAWCGQINVLKYLKSKGINLCQEDKYGQTPIFYAIKSGNLEVINYLVECGESLINRDKDGNTLLHIATSYGNIEVMQWLLDRGLKVDTLNNDDDSPLDEIIKSSSISVKALKLLQSYGAQINSEEIEEMRDDIFYDEGLNTSSVKKICIELIDWFAEIDLSDSFIEDFILSIIGEICRQGRIDKMNVLEKDIGKLALSDSNIRDLVRYAAMHQKSNIIQWLKDRYVSVSYTLFKVEKDPSNINNQIIAANWISQHGVEIIISDDTAEELIEYSIKHNNFQAIEFIKDLNPFNKVIYLPGYTGKNPIHQAAAAGDIEIMKKLHMLGIDLNSTDTDGNTPLHSAVSDKAIADNLEVIKFLTEIGVDFNATNNEGHSPLKLAINSKKYPVILLLCSLEAKMDIEDRSTVSFFSDKEEFNKVFSWGTLEQQTKAILHVIYLYQNTSQYQNCNLDEMLTSKLSEIEAAIEGEVRDILIRHNISADYTSDDQDDGAVSSINLDTPKHSIEGFNEEVHEEVHKETLGHTESKACCCVIS